MARSSLMMLLLVVALTKNEDSVCPDTVLCDKAVYENESVKFTICTTEQGHKYFTYNGTPIPQLDNSEDFVEGREISCYFLTFLALQANDNAIISFKDFNGENIDSAVLHVQGVLKAPEYFYWHGANSTHLTLVWSAPYSLFDEEMIPYELVIRRNNKEIQRLNLTALDYTMFRPYNTVVIAELTPFNPVGRGELSTLNLTDSLFYCGSTDEITADSQSFFEAGQVSVLMQLFLNVNILWCIPRGFPKELPGYYYNSNRNYCLGLSDEVKVKHSLLPDDITSSLRVEDGKIVITLHHLPFAKHLRDITIIFGSIELNLNISTYKVQSASLSDDKKTVQCYFLSGSSHNACFIVVLEDGGKAKNTLSGSDRYQLDSNTPGTFTLKIYDDMRQRDAGIEPALEITLSIDDKDSNSETDLGLVLGVPLPLLLLIIVGIVVVVVVVIAVRYNKTEAAAATKTCHPEDDDEHKTSSFVCGIEYESTRNPLHLGPSHALIGQDCLAPIRLVCTRAPALFRRTTSDQATIDDMEEGHAKSFPCGKSGIVKDSEKQADVVEGLPDTNLHPKPEETI